MAQGTSAAPGGWVKVGVGLPVCVVAGVGVGVTVVPGICISPP